MDLFSKHIQNTSNVELAKELYPVCKEILKETKEDERYLFGKTTYWQQDIMKKHFYKFNKFFRYVNEEALKFIEFLEIDNKDTEIHINDFWVSEMYRGCSHSIHTHSPENHISGNFYVHSDTNSSKIIFTRDMYNDVWYKFKRKNYTKYNSQEWSFDPEQGKLLMWESDLLHRVETNMSDSRIALTFNLKIIK